MVPGNGLHARNTGSFPAFLWMNLPITTATFASASSPRQAYLASLLGHPVPTYAHVALVLNADGARLAKRDGAVTLAEIGVERALEQIAGSLGWQANTIDEMLAQFDPAALPREPWIYSPGS